MAIPQPNIAAKFKAQGLPVFATESEAVAALNQYLSHMQMLMRHGRPPPAPYRAPRRSRGADAHMLNEADSLALVARHGLPVVRHRLCRSPRRRSRPSLEIGAPVVVKGCSATIAHKSEWGLVKLDVRSEEQVRSLYDDFDRTVRLAGARFDGVIVAEMVRGRRELMIGAHVDPVFGPVVVVGDGGKYVEAMPDLRLLLPPFDELDVARALSRGCASRPCCRACAAIRRSTSETFGEVAVAVARMMLDPACEVVSVDLNPVIVGAPGEGCAVVDALVEVAAAAA